MMATPDARPLWLIHAALPLPITIEAWTCEAKALGFTDMQAAGLCYWRWVASLDPERIERRERP
jgi:hypothetical protein